MRFRQVCKLASLSEESIFRSFFCPATKPAEPPLHPRRWSRLRPPGSRSVAPCWPQQCCDVPPLCFCRSPSVCSTECTTRSCCSATTRRLRTSSSCCAPPLRSRRETWWRSCCLVTLSPRDHSRRSQTEVLRKRELQMFPDVSVLSSTPGLSWSRRAMLAANRLTAAV